MVLLPYACQVIIKKKRWGKLAKIGAEHLKKIKTDGKSIPECNIVFFLLLFLLGV